MMSTLRTLALQILLLTEKILAASHTPPETCPARTPFDIEAMRLSLPFEAFGLATLATCYCQDQENQSVESQCSSLSSTLSLPNTATVWFTEYLPQGTNLTLPDNNVTCGRASQVIPVDLCRVALSVSTSTSSEISLEVWLPAPSLWTGRFLSTGNGGLSGCIQYEDIAYAASFGFASVGANNGHNGTSGEPFLDSPEVVADFAYRSVHTGAVVGKEVSRQFYGREHDKSYYIGCSTGGRQGFKSAQDFPGDFDGIVAGAPAIAFGNLSSWSGHFYPVTGADADGNEAWVPPELWAAVHQDVLAQCDGLDGAEDGILEDPELCGYTPENLVCASGAAGACLTGAQAETVAKVFEDLRGEDGSLVYPRMQPGSEILASYVYYSGMPFVYAADWYRYVVYNDPSWDPASLSVGDYTAASSLDPYGISTWKGDLSPFSSRGGKILHYHGLMDAIISSSNSPRYYNHVAGAMGLTSEELDEFYRFFRISGMGHCGGGDGAYAVGNTAAGYWTDDEDGNMLMAMVRWVEEGVAPEWVEGAKLGDDGSVEWRRRHCKYPKRNVFVGGEGGDSEDPDLWECV
ncbi:tannase and feruloyl esterase [Zalerion maritima]|uniref:Carboxylic ester hydrolase n=1 Tax=Zalerion maritima TaxID=339359 RepID=A0AAD5WW54_9PEZI|nr:tannase and feruloyl esterase [Zalerion maritima]